MATPPPALKQPLADLRATRADYLLSIKLLKEPAARRRMDSASQSQLGPKSSGLRDVRVVQEVYTYPCPLQPHCVFFFPLPDDAPARWQYVLVRAPAQEAS
eukprot:m.260838 g.260838  ORF g.260838 m.260838 type:complete len:101 (+) comp26651_c3_seq9:57-359(+)